MNAVYKITNLINQKQYIGSSVRVEKRWQQHKNDAFNSKNKKYNYPLYQAFRKYGIQNFAFEIIKDNFNTIEEMQQYEQDMIIKNHTLTPNGYNQTIQTNSNNIASENTQKYIKKISKKCALVNQNNHVIIPILQTQKRRIKVIGINKNDPTDIVYYNSISEAARCENLDRNSISLCMRGSTRYSHVGGRIWKKGDEDI